MLNKVQLIGNLGADPEVKQFENGNAVTNFTVATSEKYKDKKSGEMNTVTEWHSISAFGRIGEICAQFLGKGSKVYIEGKLKTRSWEDANGEKKYKTEINVLNMQMLDSKSENQSQGGSRQQGQGGGYANNQGSNQSNPDDDLPF